jgi:YD repeat-containing protein
MFDMSTSLRGIAILVATGILFPATLASQVNAPGQQRRVGRMQRDNCAVSDSTRSFRRGVGADTTGVTPGTQAITGGTARSHEYPEYDVVLDIPNVCVEKIFLKVDSVTAHLALNAQVANLLRVNAGADVLIGNVDLTIQGVRAQALLLVDLDDVVHAVDQTLTFVDNHPEVVNQLTSTVANVGGTVGGLVGGLVNSLLLGTTRNAAGQVVQRLVDQATGSILERTLSSAGQQLLQRTVGNITSLPQVSQTTNAVGQLVRRVRDQSGTLIEYVRDAAGKLSNIRVVQQ